MKKIISSILTLSLLFAVLSLGVFASENESFAYVTISTETNKHELSYEKVALTDCDNDGKLTINDALYAAHQAKFEGGAAAGYATSQTQYGLSLDKLWGISNGGWYGYYVNSASPMSLVDEIQNGDHIQAFAYTDTTAGSDTFCYFNTVKTDALVGEEISLTLSAAGYDAQWNPIVLPVASANITVNGTDSNIDTDANGKFTISFDEPGVYKISASSSTQTLVPPICVITVTENPQTGDNTALIVTLAFISIAAIAIMPVKKSYEK